MSPTQSYMPHLEQLARGSGRNIDEIFKTFLCIVACTLAQGKREELYLETIKPYKRKDLSQFEKAFASLIDDMEKHHFTDLLGGIHETLGSKKAKDMGGEFYTPEPVCKMMAQMLITSIPEEKPITIHEPCTGSGRMILATAEVLVNKGVNTRQIWVEAWDVSREAIYMTFINTSLWSIPCNVVHGNTLSLEHFDVWPNMWFYPLPKQKLEESQSTEPEFKEEEKSATPTLNREEATVKLGEGYEQMAMFNLPEKT